MPLPSTAVVATKVFFGALSTKNSSWTITLADISSAAVSVCLSAASVVMTSEVVSSTSSAVSSDGSSSCSTSNKSLPSSPPISSEVVN